MKNHMDMLIVSQEELKIFAAIYAKRRKYALDAQTKVV